MSAIREHIKVQAESATLLSRLIDLLNVAIDHPDRRDLCVTLIEEAQHTPSKLEEALQDVSLPKGGDA